MTVVRVVVRIRLTANGMRTLGETGVKRKAAGTFGRKVIVVAGLIQ